MQRVPDKTRADKTHLTCHKIQTPRKRYVTVPWSCKHIDIQHSLNVNAPNNPLLKALLLQCLLELNFLSHRKQKIQTYNLFSTAFNLRVCKRKFELCHQDSSSWGSVSSSSRKSYASKSRMRSTLSGLAAF